MNAQGLQPKNYDPLVDLFEDDEFTNKMNNIVDVVRKLADYMPAHQTYTDEHCKAHNVGE